MKTFLSILGLGILGGFIAAYIYVHGFFILWTKLANPPEKPQRILAVNKGLWIKTESSNVYYYPASEIFPFPPVACTKDCWHKYETAPINDQYISNSRGCGLHSPSTRWLADSMSVCQSFGPAAIAVAYGFDKNDILYYWLHPIGDQDGLAYITFPIQGGVYAIPVAIVWLIMLGIYKGFMKWKSPVNYDNLPDN